MFFLRETFGYIGSKWTDGPSMDQKFARKRAMQISVKVQCGTYAILCNALAKLNLTDKEVYIPLVKESLLISLSIHKLITERQNERHERKNVFF